MPKHKILAPRKNIQLRFIKQLLNFNKELLTQKANEHLKKVVSIKLGELSPYDVKPRMIVSLYNEIEKIGFEYQDVATLRKLILETKIPNC